MGITRAVRWMQGVGGLGRIDIALEFIEMLHSFLFDKALIDTVGGVQGVGLVRFESIEDRHYLLINCSLIPQRAVAYK